MHSLAARKFLFTRYIHLVEVLMEKLLKPVHRALRFSQLFPLFFCYQMYITEVEKLPLVVSDPPSPSRAVWSLKAYRKRSRKGARTAKKKLK